MLYKSHNYVQVKVIKEIGRGGGTVTPLIYLPDSPHKKNINAKEQDFIERK